MTESGSTSTAAAGGEAFIRLCLERLPSGLILNVGAGVVRQGSPGQMIVDLDLDSNALRGSPQAVAGDARQLPFCSNVFNGALLKDVLEHVQDPIGCLREVRRVATDDAVIIVTVPRDIPRAVWADPTHIRGFSGAAITKALELGGWKILERPRRIGSIPGAGHLPLLFKHSFSILRIPLLGHRLGTNWFVMAIPEPTNGS